MQERLILISNDDGISAKGLDSLIRIAQPYGKIVVVAPSTTQSGKSHSVSLTTPIRYEIRHSSKNLEKYVLFGTPVDCVKGALTKILPRKPDLMLSGINHGSNSAISVVYSGTMGAAIEASFYGIPSIGLSIVTHDLDADFETIEKTAPALIEKVLKQGLPDQVSLNVNYPVTTPEEFKGFKICSQTKSYWYEDFEETVDIHGNKSYFQHGHLVNMEPENPNCDENALAENYAAIVPVRADFTEYKMIDKLKKWNL
ncbi:MAG: 5'/3'-nucleotidase SurE [Bacteroidales bacterium]|nr:5'/3'-nucleotidase SurE [Bacteroidales bacterium]